MRADLWRCQRVSLPMNTTRFGHRCCCSRLLERSGERAATAPILHGTTDWFLIRTPRATSAANST